MKAGSADIVVVTLGGLDLTPYVRDVEFEDSYTPRFAGSNGCTFVLSNVAPRDHILLVGQRDVAAIRLTEPEHDRGINLRGVGR